jgi:ribosomal protein L7Ae-like RNA K-turn-binding protein
VLVPDLSHRLGGHGAWVHPRQACVKSALRGGFARALKCGIQVDAAELLLPARAQLVRRIVGLLAAARRRGWLAQGTDAVLAALGQAALAPRHASTAACRVSLLLVAKDAAGRRNELVTRASDWRVEVVELFDKAELGRLSGKQELGFVAILEPRIAREVADSARWLAGLSEDG